MSMQHAENFDCRKCGRVTAFTIHQTINVTHEPEYRDKVLDMSLFQFQCRYCGFSAIVHYCPLYHDMTRQYMLQVCVDENAARNNNLAEFLPNYTLQKYRLRSVVGYDELTEKIRIFDTGLDDYVIEAIKSVIVNQNPDTSSVYFMELSDNQLAFSRLYDNDEYQEALGVPYHAYLDIEQRIQAMTAVRPQKYLYVDRQFIGHLQYS
ncbi:MAG: hypothetical protein HPZ91_15620 [Lentisphaeria bacterium]|nr:hypothetical protein [Lentisphaeria bacterium]